MLVHRGLGAVLLVVLVASARFGYPWDITKGPDGNMWFTETTGKNIGVITPGGKITEYPTPDAPYGITTGPDGNIWFTEPSAGKIVRFIVRRARQSQSP